MCVCVYEVQIVCIWLQLIWVLLLNCILHSILLFGLLHTPNWDAQERNGAHDPAPPPNGGALYCFYPRVPRTLVMPLPSEHTLRRGLNCAQLLFALQEFRRTLTQLSWW